MAASDHLSRDQFTHAQLNSCWQNGECGTYTRTLQTMRPGLRVGAMGRELFDKDDPDSGVNADHYFAHDDKNAYDSLGRHPLPYQRPEFPHVELNILDHGVAEEEHEPGPDLDRAMSRAARHIQKNKILE